MKTPGRTFILIVAFLLSSPGSQAHSIQQYKLKLLSSLDILKAHFSGIVIAELIIYYMHVISFTVAVHAGDS